VLAAFGALAALEASCKTRAPAPDEPVGMPMPALVSDPAPVAAETDTGPAATALLPLAVENTWKYRVTGQSSVCIPGEHTRTVTSAQPLAGRLAFELSGFCGADLPVKLALDGSQIVALDEGQWRSALASPLEEQHAWDFSPTLSYHWHHIGWVHVPAGTFGGCWERLPEDNSWSQTYCADVGMVALSGPDLLVELESYRVTEGPRASGNEHASAHDPG